MVLFWKKKPKQQSKVKPKTNTSSSNIPKSSPPPPRPKPDIPTHKQKSEAHPNGFPKRQHPEKEFLKVFKRLTYRHRPWDVWKDFITMLACSLSNPVDKTHYDEREDLYLKTIKKYNKQEQMLFPELAAETVMALELNPEQDFLGGIFMGLDLGNYAKGQFLTPYSVCECMAAIALGDVLPQVKKQGYFTINDPCCGAGATLIAGIHETRRQLEKAGLNFQNHLLVTAQDIDYTVALMCYIQLSLLGVAGYVKIGNSLTEPMCSDDTTENYWFTAMYFSDVWTTRRILKEITLNVR